MDPAAAFGRRGLWPPFGSFGHSFGSGTRGCYDSGAVLGGELAVPCTCNPLQQG
jgi:hypothetical protein